MPQRHTRELAVLGAAGVLAAATVAWFVLPSNAATSATPIAGGTYSLSVAKSGMCLDVTAGSADNNALLQQWGCTAGTAWQQFKLVAAGSAGQFNLVNAKSGKCVDVPAKSTAGGVQLIQYTCGSAATNQLFTFVASGPGYQIKNVNSGLCLSDKDAATAAGGAIIQETCTANTNKQWVLAATNPGTTTGTGRQMEDLDRGVISVRTGTGNLVSWRMLGTDPTSVAFNVYRGSAKVNSAPITGSTNHLDTGAAASASYTVKAVVNGVEQTASPASLALANGYLDVPLSVPAGGTTPDGVAYTYSANDSSVGDVDADGDYEVIVKWDPSNSKDNSQSGYTGNVFVDAYTLQGARLWRIDLGRNIRAGAHYTQFQVYDYDGDGKAEIAMKTADGTVDGTGKVIGSPTADHRNASGYILSGPERLTMFSGQTGAALSTVDFTPARGAVSGWGDSYGNRVDRFLAGTAYLDGSRPSLIEARGYYTRSVITAWDFRDGALTKRWTFDTSTSGNSAYAGQGNHQLSVADVDSDGKDEIVYGSMALNDDGTKLWNTGNGHGDALHVGDFDRNNTGLEVFKVDEDSSKPSSWMADAATGKILWKTAANGDNGRGVAGDVYAGSGGAESWSATETGLFNSAGTVVGREPTGINFLVWWDGDPVRELLDGNKISKYGTGSDTRLLTAAEVTANNTTKANPALSGDILGDWREEVIWRKSDSSALRIYSSPIPTSTRLTTLMHDSQYRVAVAWQNTAYNQPPHPSFFLGDGMTTPAQPAIHVR
ncbi:RICIN domain-containing protein [Actinoplanes sp. NEAU-A12]|uniref:RICIN domain-containing protein n=1 Tax=Actinoplanes sandaracinus TaxID=3045177 RepID=A0ABT6WLN9_9ACTN|nr:RICIN domain-containing protein [Actinoplanes sandaracinus]MDI6100606.1 RICIN domain-containing protein [Actinoplanes sandaracinus]